MQSILILACTVGFSVALGIDKADKTKIQSNTTVYESIGTFKDIKNRECKIDGEGHLLLKVEK